ncbi:prephenate dehydratase [Pontimonas sp.]|jgi:prephenate dehydratase|uniref:prephenate dehydratase n=1 Tax=Pontimonas sp. TaxID=2304492 RepID=UPI00286FB78D|nr:prephenate dehydratase [Pontimonas sp.]MDR9396546.1 prephenate dehydratase [Pontimonas sp.]MDR9434151.1 prephenate dehydratase [Pontimonas sp.]
MTSTPARYSYLGPEGTFTWEALRQVKGAETGEWISVANLGEALDDVTSGRSDYAMIAIENSVEGGVSATQDALAHVPDLRIVGEYQVPVRFALVAPAGVTLDAVELLAAHPVAYAQCRAWLETHLPRHTHVPSSSNVQAAQDALEDDGVHAGLAPRGITERINVEVLADDIGDNPSAETRFVLIQKGGPLPERTGSDKTSIIAELPDDGPGRLLEMLEQFATRGVNMSLLESRPIGDSMGRYRFVIDLDGHIHDERVADALLGLRRFSPHVIFLGSYPRANGHTPSVSSRYTDDAFIDARRWLDAVAEGQPGES